MSEPSERDKKRVDELATSMAHAHLLAAAFAAVRAEGVAEERARVAAWLRGNAWRGCDGLVLASIVERGEHDK